MRLLSTNRRAPRSSDLTFFLELQWLKETDPMVRDSMLHLEEQARNLKSIDLLGSNVEVQFLGGGDLASHRQRFEMSNEMCLYCRAIRVCVLGVDELINLYLRFSVVCTIVMGKDLVKTASLW